MDRALRRAWTEVVTPQDYEQHMAAVGQAQAAASLTESLIGAAGLSSGSRVAVVGAGTGQMLDYLNPDLLRHFRLTFTDINPTFLELLRGRLVRHRLEAEILEDDIERTRLTPQPDLILASLVLEHIDWLRGVKSLAQLRPKMCGFVLQENPPGMDSAVTPGRKLPPSMAEAMTIAHPTLVPRDQLTEAMVRVGFRPRFTKSVPVVDRKRLIGLLFDRPRVSRSKMERLGPGASAGPSKMRSSNNGLERARAHNDGRGARRHE